MARRPYGARSRRDARNSLEFLVASSGGGAGRSRRSRTGLDHHILTLARDQAEQTEKSEQAPVEAVVIVGGFDPEGRICSSLSIQSDRREAYCSRHRDASQHRANL